MAAPTDPITELLDRYEDYEIVGRDAASGKSISGWQCENRFADSLLRSVLARAAEVDHVAYSYMEDDEALKAKILEFHLSAEGTQPQQAFPAAGSNSLLFSFVAYLKAAEVREVFYIPPLYFTLHHALRLFGIRARPVSSRHAFEASFQMNLPDRQTYLLLSDPVWYAGVQVPETVLADISAWQARTGSNVFVDGTFQLMPWTQRLSEGSAKLASDSTLRVISPTKSLAIHGYRFAYLLLPNKQYRSFANVHGAIYSSDIEENRLFAHEAIRAIGERTITNSLISLAQQRYNLMDEKGLIGQRIEPTSGYFVFAEPKREIRAFPHLLDGNYFDQRRLPNHVRINLLSPQLSLLL